MDTIEEILEELTTHLLQYDNAYLNVPKKLKNLASKTVVDDEKAVILANWGEVMESKLGGDCVTLAQRYLYTIKGSFVSDTMAEHGYELLYAEGTEPQFFNTENDNHAFTVLVETENNTPLHIFDPALQFADEFGRSGYEIRSITRNYDFERAMERPITVSKKTTLESFETALIGLDSCREYALSLGFYHDKSIKPFLKLSNAKRRYFVFSKHDISGLPINPASDISTSVAFLQLFDIANL